MTVLVLVCFRRFLCVKILLKILVQIVLFLHLIPKCLSIFISLGISGGFEEVNCLRFWCQTAPSPSRVDGVVKLS